MKDKQYCKTHIDPKVDVGEVFKLIVNSHLVINLNIIIGMKNPLDVK